METRPIQKKFHSYNGNHSKRLKATDPTLVASPKKYMLYAMKEVIVATSTYQKGEPIRWITADPKHDSVHAIVLPQAQEQVQHVEDDDVAPHCQVLIHRERAANTNGIHHRKRRKHKSTDHFLH